MAEISQATVVADRAETTHARAGYVAPSLVRIGSMNEKLKTPPLVKSV